MKREETGRLSSLALAAAALIMIGNIFSRLLAIGREMVASYYFGVSSVMDAFTIADNVRTMLFDLLISGTISAALIPVLSDYVAPARRPELRRILVTLLILVMIGAGLIVAVLILLAPQVVAVMTALTPPPGQKAMPSQPPDAGLTTELVRAILPSVWLLSLSAILLATLQALQRFRLYSVSLLVPNAALIVAVVIFHDQLGIMAMVLGTVLGAALLVLLELPGLGDILRPARFIPTHPAIQRIGRLYAPIFLGLIVSTIALIIDRNLASALQAGVLSAMRYATQVQQMALGLVGAAIALATLPALAAAAGAGNLESFRRTLYAGLRLITVLSVPATLGLLALAEPITLLLFRRGATSGADAALITEALLGYLPGIPAAAIDQLLIFAYYARKNTRTPVLVGIGADLFFLVMALLLLPILAMLGLVLANSARFIFHAVIMLWLVRRSLGGLGWRQLGQLFLATLGAGLPMAALAFGLTWLLRPLPGVAGDLGRVLLPAAVGAILYLWLLRRLGVNDLAMIGHLVARRLGR